jgi:hypothetical protein
LRAKRGVGVAVVVDMRRRCRRTYASIASRGCASQGRAQVIAFAPHRCRHRREAGDAAAAQRLQQEGLGLVAPVDARAAPGRCRCSSAIVRSAR